MLSPEPMPFPFTGSLSVPIISQLSAFLNASDIPHDIRADRIYVADKETAKAAKDSCIEATKQLLGTLYKLPNF
jgi:hypothetical protein